MTSVCPRMPSNATAPPFYRGGYRRHSDASTVLNILTIRTGNGKGDERILRGILENSGDTILNSEETRYSYDTITAISSE